MCIAAARAKFYVLKIGISWPPRLKTLHTRAIAYLVIHWAFIFRSLNVTALQPCRVTPVSPPSERRYAMNSIVYIVGAVVIVLFILGFLGLR
ncbi:hypothetical protein [Roseococcus suduntuyensis]|uniref:Uncharacterized protein n=1 Tax=Roseococcus suduntuyensis TaxID=455361 RepID=A0A840ACF8_9PROT|nr:hypothetical protein [Roseococcus suduntuyensis]MBB3898216.1 hypothetical protein [Roseococcus suduntuyensis]